MIDTVTIRSVWTNRTRTPGVVRYLITAQTLEGRWLSCATVNAWLASVCQRAQESGRIVTVTHDATEYFDDRLVAVEDQ